MKNANGWVKATRSGNNGNCVEMKRDAADKYLVRDSKDPDGPVLTFTRDEFEAWIDGAKRGEFDTL